MPPLQTAILLHTTVDGKHHFDWLLADSTNALPQAQETSCWRCPGLLTAMSINEHMVVEPLSKHRGLYLTLDAARELDGGRGTVTPVKRGWAREFFARGQPAGNTNPARTVEPRQKLPAPISEDPCRNFILNFEDSEPLCVALRGDRLTRVEGFFLDPPGSSEGVPHQRAPSDQREGHLGERPKDSSDGRPGRGPQ